MYRTVICLGGLMLIAGASGARAQVFTAPVMVDQLQDMPAPSLSGPSSENVPANAAPPPATTAPSGPSPGSSPSAQSSTPDVELNASPNPLWSIPLSSLKATRERPLFSPSRRLAPVAKAAPPPPPAPPPKPPEPERLQLSLVGTVVGEGGKRVGLFVNSADNSSVRLKVGDDHQGWVLRELAPLHATLDKGQQSTVLELPRPDARRDMVAAPAPAVALKPASTPGSPPAVAPINIVKPPAPSAPQVNPFQKFWSR